MKKFIIATAIATTSMFASATDVAVSAIHDYTAEKTGVKVSTAAYGVGVSISHVEGAYTRYGAGKDFALMNVGPVTLGATVAGVYQNTYNGTNGFGLTAGVKASMPISKSMTLVAGVDRFMGQDRVSASNGNVASVGVTLKF